MKNYYQKKLSASFRMSAILFSMFLLVTSFAYAQNKTVRGNIVDESGKAAIGVTIMVKGTTTGAVTNAEGVFSLSAPTNGTLVISSLGYQSQEIPIEGKTVINAIIKEDAQTMEEVVVVGYGSVRKSDVTGALTQVSEKTLRERPVQNAIQAMQGKAAGVDIGSNIRPGEVASISIRGTRSIDASNSPLYVVDGVVLMGNMNDINPNDIASIEILKDASSTAIYGSRGANGVVLISTKKGSKGRVSVDYTGTVSFDQINSLTDWASSGELMDRMRLAEINGGTYKSGTNTLNYPDPTADINKFGNSDPATIAAIRSGYEWVNENTVKMRTSTAAEKALGYPDQIPVYNSGNISSTDWIDMLTRVGVTQNHQISLAAGNDISNLYTSIGYYDNKGTQENQGFTRYTARINGDITPVKWLTVGTSLNAAFSEQQYGRINRSGSATGAQDMYGMALGQYRMAKPYDDEGKMIDYPGNNKAAPTWNPFIDLRNTDDLVRRFNLQANAYADVRFTPWLKYRLNFGAGYRTETDGRWQGSNSTLRRTANPKTASASFENKVDMQYLIENILYFNKTVGIHDFGATLVQSAQKFKREGSKISSSKIFYDTAKWFDLKANLNGSPDDYGSSFSENSLMSYMARINYGLKGKYLLTASMRYDGASVLAPGNKWDTFPSVAVAWKMQEEPFMKNVKWVDELKLRAGYGVTGNSAVGAYSTSGPIVRYNYVWGAGTPGIGMLPYTMPNPSLGWEKTAQYNVGIDYSVLNRRLSGSIEFYRSNTTDVLMNRNISPVTGFVSIKDNIGEIRNTGLEISINSVNIENQNFRWTTNLNFTTNKEEIVSLAMGKKDMESNNWFIGQPLQVFRGYKYDGLWQDTPEDKAEIAKWAANGYNFQPGQYKPVEVADTSGKFDYKLTDKDKVIRGSDRPACIIGMTNNFSYKNWEFSFFVYARLGQEYFSSLNPAGMTGGSYVGYGRSVSPDKFWSPTNPGAKYPQPTTYSKASNADVNRSTFINDGSFVAVRNISLAYNFPEKWLKKIDMKHLQVYGQVMNPFLFGGAAVKAGLNPDDTNGWTSVNSVGDPTGGSNNNTMMITSFALGLRVGF